jgi:hypothetical protein
MNGPRCEACGAGAPVAKKVYRRGGVAVVVGYVLLVASALGLLVAILLFVVSGDATTKDLSQKLKDDVSSDLKAAGVPRGVIDKVTGLQKVTEDDKNDLTEKQKGAISSAQSRMAHGPFPSLRFG